MQGSISGSNRVLKVEELSPMRVEYLKKRGFSHGINDNLERGKRINQLRIEKVKKNMIKVFTPMVDRVLKEGTQSVMDDVDSEYIPVKFVPGGNDNPTEEVKNPNILGSRGIRHNHKEMLERNAYKLSSKISGADDLIIKEEYQKIIDKALEQDFRTRLVQKESNKKNVQDTYVQKFPGLDDILNTIYHDSEQYQRESIIQLKKEALKETEVEGTEVNLPK